MSRGSDLFAAVCLARGRRRAVPAFAAAAPRVWRVLCGATAVVAVVVVGAGCAPPGTPVQKIQAAKLGVATSSISAACGYVWELTAFGGRHGPGIAAQESTAVAAAHKLVTVYRHSPSDIYQGESVGSVLSDTVDLLDECGLPRAKRVLQQALAGR
jgi:hypothetical protein